MFPMPFPKRLKCEVNGKFRKFLDIIKSVYINICFADALEQMPRCVKFMKAIMNKKRRVDDHEVVAMTKICSFVLERKLPPKLKDLGRFTIPCSIGSIESPALCDLGSRVNLIPYSLYEKLGLGDLKPTTITLQLINQLVIFPRGIVENILVNVKNLILPIDFFVVDIKKILVQVKNFIMGRLFLATGRTIIDVERGELITWVYNESVVIKFLKQVTF